MKKSKNEWWKAEAGEISLQGMVETCLRAKEEHRIGAMGPAVAVELGGQERNQKNPKQQQSGRVGKAREKGKEA